MIMNIIKLIMNRKHQRFLTKLLVVLSVVILAACDREGNDGIKGPLEYVISYNDEARAVRKTSYSISVPKEGGEFSLYPLPGSKKTARVIAFSDIYVNGVSDDKYVSEWDKCQNLPLDGVSLTSEWGYVSFESFDDDNNQYKTTVKIYPNPSNEEREIEFVISNHIIRAFLSITQE